MLQHLLKPKTLHTTLHSPHLPLGGGTFFFSKCFPVIEMEAAYKA
uniref:Uncharacterized protein n=1 Tax=Anguilla anguilla TaxID=7936 RepID=A0A0E9WQH8_ANGAN